MEANKAGSPGFWILRRSCRVVELSDWWRGQTVRSWGEDDGQQVGQMVMESCRKTNAEKTQTGTHTWNVTRACAHTCTGHSRTLDLYQMCYFNVPNVLNKLHLYSSLQKWFTINVPHSAIHTLTHTNGKTLPCKGTISLWGAIGG